MKRYDGRIGRRFLVFAGCLLVVAQNVGAQSELTKLVNYTLEHSHKIKKSELMVEESNYLRKEAIAQGLPQVEGTTTYNKMFLGKIDIPASVYDMVSDDYKPMLDQISAIKHVYSSNIGIQVTQLIYSQSYVIGLKTVKKTQELYSILRAQNEEDVVAEVANNYYQTGSLLLQLKTIEMSLENLNSLYKIVELNYKNDMVKETELSRLKVTITNLDVTRQSLKNGVDIQINYLKALAGMPADSSLHILPESFIANFNSRPKVDFNIANVPAYQVLLKQEELSQQQINLNKAKYYPTLAAFGQFKFSSFGTTTKIDKLNNLNTIGLNLKIPIFTSGSNYYKVRQSELKRDQLNEDIEQSKQLLTIQYKNAYSEFLTASSLLLVQKENRDLAEKVYKQTLLQYQEGMASLADLLNVNSDLLQADNTYNQQILKCKTSEVNMFKASGSLKLLSENN